ncbi:hypothetical protein PM10SUCC1_28570 [Propionigenium maris DSM 9537]|uniref:Uncharacterized protein n=1 Tax=Propionigenium maris DSM 9537 TaxID=1123000 RepID=A0A9W6GMR9_9FUSO|nr:hypothetical protein [Propionigenium maris]GLI57343.1 hypothetical protein PM10SUCC1_28570 [Propionigenium maris DSM 9537]
MKEILKRIEKEIEEVSKDSGHGEILIEVHNGKVCFIRPTKSIKI